eukprot:3930432-Prymnesium_polylepis.1
MAAIEAVAPRAGDALRGASPLGGKGETAVERHVGATTFSGVHYRFHADHTEVLWVYYIRSHEEAATIHQIDCVHLARNDVETPRHV